MNNILSLWKQQGGHGILETDNHQEIVKLIKIAIEAMPNSNIGIITTSMKYHIYRRQFPDNVLSQQETYYNVGFKKNYAILFVIGVDEATYSLLNGLKLLKAKYKFYTATDYSKVPDYIKEQAKKITSDVKVYKEFNYIIPMAVEQEALYNKVESTMKDIIGVFRDYDVLNNCLTGDNQKSASAYRDEVAANNGWNKDLNVAIPMFAQIDKYYNPDNLFEQATLYNSLVRERANIIAKSNDKLNHVISVILANGKKQMIVSVKGDDTCNEFVINLKRKGIRVEAVHANTPKDYIHDVVTDKPLTYKTGAKKGEAKVFGATLMNKHYLSLFEARKLQVIVTTGTIDKSSMVTGCDLFIVSSPKTANYFRIKSRIAKFEFSNNINIVNVTYDVSKDLEEFKVTQRALNVNVKDVFNLTDVII